MWPESHGTGSGPAHSDLFNLRPEDGRVNSPRGDNYYDESDPADRLSRKPAHANAPLCSADGDSWEPPARVKWDIARTMFYMDVRYEGDTDEPDLVLTDTTVSKTASSNLLIQTPLLTPSVSRRPMRPDQPQCPQGVVESKAGPFWAKRVRFSRSHLSTGS